MRRIDRSGPTDPSSSQATVQLRSFISSSCKARSATAAAATDGTEVDVECDDGVRIEMTPKGADLAVFLCADIGVVAVRAQSLRECALARGARSNDDDAEPAGLNRRRGLHRSHLTAKA